MQTGGTKKEYVITSKIRAQAWKYYFVVLAWPAYLFFLPYVFQRLGPLSLAFMIFPGVYLFTWVGFLMHEAWHKYVPNIPNKFFYNALAYMLLTDPQVYYIVHGYHHSMVHTWDDTEFHPLGYIKDRRRRQLYNSLEVFVGIAFLAVVARFAVPKNPRYKARYRLWKAAVSVPVLILFIGGLAFASYVLLGASLISIAISYIITIWINSLMIHHSQMVEHGNLIVDGDFHQRNIWTHNLDDRKIPEKIFLFLTHSDSREHVLHHTLTSVYSRPFPHKVPMPPESVFINLRDYFGIVAQMLRGEVVPIKPQPPEVHSSLT